MPEKTARIAVLFFGLPRCSSVCMPSVEKNIFAPLRQLGPAVEATPLHHLYQQHQVVNPRSNENGTLGEDNYQWFADKHGIIQPPEQARAIDMVDQALAFGDTYLDGGISIRNLILQLNSLREVTRLFTESDHDMAVFARPDLEYHDPLPLNALRFALRNPKACVVPGWQSWGGCNDRFAICGREAAAVYGRRLDDVLAFCKEGPRSLHAEQLLKYSITSHRMTLRTMPIRASRVRIDGTRKEESFSVYASAPKSRVAKLKLLYLEKLSMLM